MKVLAVLLALASTCLYVQAQNVVCGKGTSSKTVTLEDGESYSFKTHKGKKYKGNTECTVDYKMGDTCAEMSFACTKFNTNNKDKKKCKKGDMVTITANGKAKAYCKTKKPKVTSSGDMQVVFSSDAKKHSSGAICKVTCTEAASTTATTTEAAGGGGAGFSQLTQDQIDTILRISRRTIGGSKTTAVRLTFHDCVGGCNGCLNVNNPDNKGLEGLVADIETVYQENNFSEIISRADLWALLGIWSINQTIIQNNEDCDDCEEVPELDVTFKWGRKDCATAPYSDDDVGLPAATLGHSKLMEFFSDEFDFNAREVTALMGVHTLGKAAIFNSGFHGTWVSGEQGFFNNQYFINMASLNWNLAQRPCTSLANGNIETCSSGQTTGWQWNVGGTGFNLNADMAIFKDFDTDSDGKPSCTYSTCPSAPTATDVEEFAASNIVWIQDFSKVYTKMLAHGSSQLQDVN